MNSTTEELIYNLLLQGYDAKGKVVYTEVATDGEMVLTWIESLSLQTDMNEALLKRTKSLLGEDFVDSAGRDAELKDALVRLKNKARSTYHQSQLHERRKAVLQLIQDLSSSSSRPSPSSVSSGSSSSSSRVFRRRKEGPSSTEFTKKLLSHYASNDQSIGGLIATLLLALGRQLQISQNVVVWDIDIDLLAERGSESRTLLLRTFLSLGSFSFGNSHINNKSTSESSSSSPDSLGVLNGISTSSSPNNDLSHPGKAAAEHEDYRGGATVLIRWECSPHLSDAYLHRLCKIIRKNLSRQLLSRYTEEDGQTLFSINPSVVRTNVDGEEEDASFYFCNRVFVCFP